MDENVNNLFTKYVKSNNKQNKVLLLYLLLNNYNMSEVKYLEDAEEDKMFGLKYRKVYGITEEFVDTDKISDELNAIKVPTIYSQKTFELYSQSKTIHLYRRKLDDYELRVNDLGIISNAMIITEKCIVSSNMARQDSDIPQDERGFMYFVQYVINNKLTFEKWQIVYENKCFAIYYISEKDGKKFRENLYMAVEIDKASTYRLVIYIIKKVSQTISNWLPDNFIDEAYDLIY